MEENCITRYTYDEKDLHYQIQNDSEASRFDDILREKWNAAEENDVLRYSVKCQQYKVLDGQFGFYAQLNTERATMRRKPEEITSMEQAFDPDKFNFTKISYKEILLDVGDGRGDDVIAVNVSPITAYHCLILPQRFSCLPQSATLYSLRKALEVLLLSKSKNVRVVFNSLCANASINHLHWHVYYLDHRMLLEWIPLKSFVDAVYTLEKFPAQGFCIKLSSFPTNDIDQYVSYTYNVISCLQKNLIAHNVYITRSTTDPDKKLYDDIRVYIWARSPSYGAKNTEDFIIAACEVFGHLPIRTKEAYERLKEDYVVNCLESVTSKAFLLAKRKIAEALSGSEREKKNRNEAST